MKRKALALSISIVFSLLLLSPVQAENWSTPTPVIYLGSVDGLSISADGYKIVFAYQNGSDFDREIFVVNSDGTGLKQLTSDFKQNVEPVISGDGSKIAFTSYLQETLPWGETRAVDTKVFVVNSDGTELRQIPENTGAGSPSISEDGAKIAFVTSVDDNAYISVANTDGTGLKQLTADPSYKYAYPSISGDGSRIAFAAWKDENNYEVFIINSDGTGLTSLLSLSGFIDRPSISGDGNKIAFQAYLNGAYSLFVVNSDGTKLTSLISNPSPILDSSISGDGSRIAFVAMTDENNYEVFIINSDGTGLRQITANTASDRYSSVSSDGSKLAFHSRILTPAPVEVGLGYNGIYASVDLDMDLTAPVSSDDYDGLWRVADFNINLAATDDLSGVAETYYRINDGEVQTVAANGQPFISKEGADNKLEYWSVDIAGNQETSKTLTEIKLDKTAPTGSITINNDDVSTSSTSVSLSLSTNDTSGVDQMRLSNNGTEWTSWEQYTSFKSWTLTTEEGTKTVQVQFKDNAGWVSDVYSDTINFSIASHFLTTLIVGSVITAVVTAAGLLFYFKKRKH